jgi:hypothetical protein
MFRLSQWRPRELLIAWIAWWVAVPLATLGKAILIIQRIASDHGAQSSISLNGGDAGLSMSIVDAGKTIWTGSVGLLPAVLVMAVPPLLLWLAWLRARPRGGRLSTEAPNLLNEPLDIPRAESRDKTYDNSSRK